MGEVFEAKDLERGTIVALKRLRFADPQGIYRFKQEFRALQDIGHPNLVRLGELFEFEGDWFFTMELVDGVDFLSYVRAGCATGYDEQRVRASFGQLARGLIAIHSAGKVHRDVKPTNIMVTATGRVVLLDFGLSLDTQSGESTEGLLVGTVAYMAPEQAASKRIGPAADMYSAGTLLYETLTGDVPFIGMPLEICMQKQRHEPVPPSARINNVPADLDALCVDLLRFDPDRRPTGVQVLERLGMDEPEQATLRTPLPDDAPFVGRDDEMATLQIGLDDSARESSVVMFVRGESGMGKSELVRRFVDTLRHNTADATVLCGRCYERESVPYKAFDGIADSLSRHLAQLADAQVAQLLPDNASLLGRLFPVLRRVEAVARMPTGYDSSIDPQLLRTQMFAALRELFQRIATRGPVVLVVDDFQWADADSLTLLTELLHPPDPPPLLLLATIRSENPEVLRRFEAMVRPAGNDFRVLDIGALTESTTLKLVDLLAPELRNRASTRQAIATESGGHPLFVRELVRHLQDGADAKVGTRLDDALWSRVERLPEQARYLLETLCVAGTPITQAVACHATRHTYLEHERATAVLRLSQLARTAGVRETDTIESYHDRIREAVLAKLSLQRQHHCHERLAIALERAGAGTYDPQALVRHLEAANRQQDAAIRASEGAVRAYEALAFDRAAELFRAALRLGGANEHATATTRSLADALANAGRGLEAAEAYIETAEQGDPAVQLECRRLAAEQLLRSGHIQEGMAAYKKLLGHIGITLPDSSRRALLSLLWCRLRLRLRGLRWKTKHPSEIALADLTRVDTYRAVGHSLGMVDNVRGADFQARSLLAALKVGERRRILLAMSAEAIYVGSQGGRGLVRAHKLVARVRAMGDEGDDCMVLGWQAAADGIVGYMGGDFLTAARTLAEAVDLFRNATTGGAWEFNTARMFRVFALKHAGRVNEVEHLYFDYIRDAERRGDLYMETSTLRYGTFLWLARDRVQQARDNLERATWLPPQGRYHLQHWFELEALGDVALYEGNSSSFLADVRPQFRELESSLLLRVQIIRCLSRWLRGRLLLSHVEQTGDASGLREVARLAKQLRKEGVCHATVWGGLLQAGLCFQLGDDDGAVGHLREVASVASERDIGLVAASAQARLGRLVAGDEGSMLAETGEAGMRAERVAKPARMVGMIAPGFAARKA